MGFRGFLDQPFWHSDPSMANDADNAAKAAVINRAVQLQYDLVRELRPGESHQFVFYCRGEMYPLLEQGLLELPPETTLLFTPGQPSEPLADAHPRRGLYAWANFFNRWSDMRIMDRQPETIADTMSEAVEAGNTEMLVLNVGNLREKGFHIRQYMHLATDYPAWRGLAAGDQWTHTYVQMVLKADSQQLEEVYRRLTRLENRLVPRGDEGVFTVVEFLLKELYTGGDGATLPVLKTVPGDTLSDKVIQLATAFAHSADRWQTAWQRARVAEADVHPALQLFYRQEALAQTEKMYHLDSTIHDFCLSAVSYLQADYAPARNQAWQAVQHIDDALKLENRIDTDRFQGWHRNDMNCRTWKIKELLTTWHRMLDDLRFLNLPFQSRNPKLTYRHQYQPDFDSEYMRNGELMIDNEA
ncbi:MAG: glycosyl hydrolase 115 family protein [bacterium]